MCSQISILCFFNIRSSLFVSSRLFIVLYILVKFLPALLFPSVVSCISFNLSSYARSSKSGTILVGELDCHWLRGGGNDS